MEEQNYDETFLRNINDQAGILECYERYGAVGVTGVLSTSECTAAIHALESYLPTGCQISDTNSHYLAGGACNRYGVIGKAPLFNPDLLSVRLHQNVALAFETVYRTQEIYACHDRAAWMRPALEHPEYSTPFEAPGIHLDVSPRSYWGGNMTWPAVESSMLSRTYADYRDFAGENNCKHRCQGRVVQAVINLLDNELEDGGFHFVPSIFGDKVASWAIGGCTTESESNGRHNFSSSGPDVALLEQHRWWGINSTAHGTCRIPCPAGTVLLFDATIPHGTIPNTSCRSRAILFSRFITRDHLPPAVWNQRNASMERICRNSGFEPDEREQALLFCRSRASHRHMHVEGRKKMKGK